MSGTNGICGAKARGTGKPCRRPAGWGTPHAEGKCKLHGGATPSRHGRYSKLKRGQIAHLVQQYLDDSDPLNLQPELAAMRALFEDFIERYETWREAVLAWHESFNESEKPKPRQIMDIADARKIISEIGRLAERIQKIQSQNAISAPELYRIFSEIKQVIDLHVDDREVRERLADRLGSIRVALNP